MRKKIGKEPHNRIIDNIRKSHRDLSLVLTSIGGTWDVSNVDRNLLSNASSPASVVVVVVVVVVPGASFILSRFVSSSFSSVSATAVLHTGQQPWRSINQGLMQSL